MDFFRLLNTCPPPPRHRRDNVPAPAPARTTRAQRPDNIVHLTSGSWRRSEEHPDTEQTLYVLDATTSPLTELSPDMDEIDYKHCEYRNLREETYAALKPIWATGVGSKAAGNNHKVKNMRYAGERTRAECWAAMNAAQRERTQ